MPCHNNTNRIFLSIPRRNHSTTLFHQRWSVGCCIPMNRFTQVRCRSINPYDDDEFDYEDAHELIESIISHDDDEPTTVTPKLRSKMGDDDDAYESDGNDYDGDDSNEDQKVVDPEHPTQNIKRFEVPAGRTPGPILFRNTGQETFFQFDYRNVPIHEKMQVNLASLLKKIQMTLKDTELEPYHMRRGCETLRNNIENLPDRTSFRVGGDKKSVRKLGVGYDQAINVTTHRALRKSIFYLLWERHAILTSGTTHEWKKLTPKMIGQSLLGPDTRLVVDQQLGKDVIQELWIRGVSSKYNRLIQRHKDRSGENNFIRYLKPPSKNEIAEMNWDTDLGLNSTEKWKP